MKKLHSLLAIATIAIGLSLSPIGCTTDTNNKVAKAEAAIIPSVNVAMELWKARVESGRVTQKQVDQVRDAYQSYFNAQLILKAALEKSIASKLPSDERSAAIAAKSAEDAKTSILSLIDQFLK